MMKKISANLLLIVALCASSVSQAFLDKDREAAISSYADQMISLFQQPAITFATDRTLLLKRYMQQDDSDLQQLLDMYAEIDRMLSAMENYAVAVSTLSTTGASEAEVIEQLAKQFEQFSDNLGDADIELSNPDFPTRLQVLRQQEDYLDALEVAQPMITAFGRYGQDVLTRYEDRLASYSQKLHGLITDDYRGLVEFKDVIDDRRIQFLSRVDTEKPNDPDAENAVIAQLNQLSRITAVTQPYIQHFWDTQAELNSITNEIYFNTARLKLTLLIWVRAHAQLASGISDGEAFDVMEYKNLIEEAAKFGKDLADS